MPSHDALQAYLNAGMGVASDTEVARRLGVSRQAVHQRRARAGIVSPESLEPAISKPTAIPVDPELIALVRARHTTAHVAQIAAEAGVPQHRVQRVVQDLGLKTPKADNRSVMHRAWRTINWSKSNPKIAEEWNAAHPDDPVSVHAVTTLRMRLRRKYGAKRVPYLMHPKEE